ncbi:MULTISPECIES: type IVB secretion system protein IcmH/DotU [unclassified Pseudomonas]|uniref:type IVB secretion system protein IcmH/DotU n=1 Tax=unclassified Pseudomonas TaxID=196821 RepID=UPI00128D4942|nr:MULTISPECIES: type IVB secretion system protein IcmH/DotU [unclassified Pseudomonas]MPQ71088.1 DotU family type IV/VI secretion system protein [Pseudomonas sp. MWU12-2323]
MNNASFAPDDRKTVVVSRDGREPEQSTLTDLNAARHKPLRPQRIESHRYAPVELFETGINPLAGAASPLLAEIVGLRHQKHPEPLDQLQERLLTALKRFEQRAHHKGMEQNAILDARYLLCTAIDEAVLSTDWGAGWSGKTLLGQLHNQTSGGEQCFQMMKRLLERPAVHLQMLELMFLCVCLGFKGKYALEANGTRELEEIREELYRKIRAERGPVPRELSPHWQGQRPKPQRPPRIVPWWMVTLFTLISLGALYTGFAWVLGEQREDVLKLFEIHGTASAVQSS